MTKPKRVLITAIMALAVFGALLGAAYYSETLKNATLTVLSVIGYLGLTAAFYWLLGDSREPTPTQKAYVAPVAYDYEADIGRIEKEVSKTVDEILAEENGKQEL